MRELSRLAEKALAVGIGALVTYWLYRAITAWLTDASFAGVILVLAVFFVGILAGSAFFVAVETLRARPARRIAVDAIALAAIVLGLILPAKLRADAGRAGASAPVAAPHR